jgi:hypothetical protein
MIVRTQGRIAIGVVVSLAATPLWPQVPFSLDTNYRTTIQDRNVDHIHLLPDGKLFLSGQIRFPEDYNAGNISFRGSARLLSDGTRDPDFTGFWGGGKVVPWADDQFYVGVGLPRRMLWDGMLDPSFISMATGPYFSPIQAGDFHVYPDGSVLISGAHMLSDTIRGFTGPHHLIWFTNTGYLDTTRTHRQAGGAVYRFAELPDGKFICNGTSFSYGGQAVDRIFRIHPDGALDTTFQTGVYIGTAFTYLPLPDGRVYVGGNYETTQAPGDTLRLARFLADGTLDPTFSSPAFIAGEGLTTPYGAYVFGIRPWTNGRLIVNGHFKYVNGQPRRGICMIDTTGQLLDEFHDQGVGAFTFQGLTAASVQATLVSPDSAYLYLCGRYWGYNDGLISDPDQRFVTRLHVGDITTGVAQPALLDEVLMQLYPNPAAHHVTVALSGPTAGTELLLRDALGRTLLRERPGGPVHNLPLQGLGAGLYLVELWGQGGRQAVERLVVE